MYDARNIIVRPIVSEKSYTLMEMNKYTFEVDKRATKPHIAQAVQEIFGVTVKDVNTINVPGKPRKLRYSKGLTRTWKKAIVTLKDGDKIDLFEGR